MTGEPGTAPATLFVRAAAVLAALLFGVVVLTWFATVVVETTGYVVAVLVLLVGVAVFLAARRPGPLGAPVARGIGGGLAFLGVHLLATTWMVSMAIADPGAPGSPRAVLTLVLFGLPALAALLLAVATGARAWTGATGILVVALGASVGGILAGDQFAFALPVLVVAVVLTVLAVLAPSGAAWGDLVGAAAATATTYAGGLGFSLVGTIVLQQGPLRSTVGDGLPSAFTQVVCTFGGLLLATVLVLVATVRRDPATGLVAATLLALPITVPLPDIAPWRPFVWLPAVVLVVALVGLRIPAVRAALARVPVALRERAPAGATTAAGCAAVAGAALVVFAVRGLADLDASRTMAGVVALVLLVLTGAAAHALPSPAGAALAVVTLVGLFLARPWANLLLDAPTAPVTGVLGLVELVTALVAVGLLAHRHATQAVWAAGAYLLLGTLPGVLVPLFGLSGDRSPDPSGHAVVLVLPLLIVGLPAAVLAWWWRHAAHWQAVGAVVLGATLLLPLRMSLAFATRDQSAVPTPRASPLDPLAPTDVLYSTSFLDGDGTTAVLVVLLLLAAVSVLSLARRPSTPLAVAAALSVYAIWPMASFRLKDYYDDLDLLTSLIVVLVVLVVAGAVVLVRHRSRNRVVQEA